MKSNLTVKLFVYFFVLLLLCFTSDIQNAWIQSHWETTITDFSKYLNNNEQVNLLFSLAIVLTMLYGFYKNITNYSKKWLLGGFVLASDCLLLLSQEYWTWNKSSFGINWCVLIIITITIPIISSLFVPKAMKSHLIQCFEKCQLIFKRNQEQYYNRFFKKTKHGQKPNNDLLGFCIDNVDNNPTDDHIRQPYADLIVKKAIVTNSKESFAIGVSGDWGSGKTLFLNHIETAIKQQKEISNNILLIKFCPWESYDSRQIIVDFFNTLCDKIAPYYSDIRKPILKYAELLTMADAPNWLVSAFNILDRNRQLSINQLKSRISNCLKTFDKKVFILIDDIDRLNEQEIYETLKLIRNTADFANIIYIVSYDKKYICEQISEFGIKSSDLYIEKIFPVEIKLQSPEPHFQASCMLSSILQMSNDDYLNKTAFNIVYYNEDIINIILLTFRQVKRFSRQFILNIEAIKENHLYNDISIEDFFLLELLYYHNSELYNDLKNNPTKILYTTNDFKYKIKRYNLRSGINGSPTKPNEIYSYKGNPIDEKSIIILQKLFNKQDSHRKITQLLYTESYHKYFSFGISYNQISLKEVNDFINSTKDIDTQIEKWCSNKKTNSLFSLLLSYNSGNDIFVIKRYISIILSYARLYTGSDIGLLLSTAFRLTKYDTDSYSELQYYTTSEIKKCIQNFSHSQEYTQFAKGLAQIFHDEYNEYQRTGDDGYSLIGSCENVKTLLIENVDSYLSKNPNKADNLFDVNYSIHTLVIASAIVLDSDEGNYYTSVIFDYLFKYFSSNKGKNKHLAESFFNIDTSDHPTDDELNDRRTKKEILLSQMFGNKDNYQRFIDNCFE